MSLIGDAVSVEHRLAVIGRFNERVDAAQQAAEPTKAWVQRSVRREGAPRCPVRLRRVSLELVLRYGDALADLFVQYPDDITLISAYDQFVGHQPPGDAQPVMRHSAPPLPGHPGALSVESPCVSAPEM